MDIKQYIGDLSPAQLARLKKSAKIAYDEVICCIDDSMDRSNSTLYLKIEANRYSFVHHHNPKKCQNIWGDLSKLSPYTIKCFEKAQKQWEEHISYVRDFFCLPSEGRTAIKDLQLLKDVLCELLGYPQGYHPPFQQKFAEWLHATPWEKAKMYQ